jgi:hypothetical protein
MTDELEEALFAIEPRWFDRDPRRGTMWFGFACADGWFCILRDLFVSLKPMAPEGFKVSQVKAKFGTLRVYASGTTPDVYRAIKEAEDKSRRTCEVCGQPGALYEEDSASCRANCLDCEQMRIAFMQTPSGYQPQ